MDSVKVGDTITNPTLDEMDELLKKFDCEWIGIGVLKVCCEKEMDKYE